MCFLLPLVLIHAKSSSLCHLSTRAVFTFLVSVLSLVDAAGARHRRKVLRSSGLRAESFHDRGRDDAVDGGHRRVEIGL